MAIFTDVFEDVTKQGRKIPTSDYHETGVHPIIDQGQSAIAGYTDEENGLFTDVPAIIFGDHTRVLKYVDTPCFLGADGVKLLKAKIANPNYKYLYYVLSNANIPNTGYNRHFKWLKEVDIPLPDADKQQEIVDILDKINKLIVLRKEQLAKLDQLVKSRFIELFGDIASCPKYDGVTLGTICTTLSGGTPTTKVPEYYAGDIPWISTPYLGNNHINGSSAKAYITEEAIKNSATHLIPANTIMFGIRVGVGKSSIIDEPMCANQDIVALMGIDTSKYNLLFVKHVLDAYQSHFDSIKKGATILGITTEDLKKVLVPTVDVEIQNQFADFVEQVDKSKLAIQQSLDKLELLKKSLMQEYFG